MSKNLGFLSDLPNDDFLSRNTSGPFIQIATETPKDEPVMPVIPDELRDKHVHILGKTGYGKTTLLAHQALRDIHRRKGGVCIIDPKGGVGGFAEIVSRYIPEDRIEDCVWLDVENPIPLDVMSCPPKKESRVVADLVYILTQGKLDPSHAPDIASNLEYLLHTLIDANKHPKMPENKRCTFMDVYRFFEEGDRRTEILSYVRDRRYQTPWEPGNFPDKTARGRIRTRISPWVNNLTLCTILGEPVPKLNIEELIENKKIIIVSVPDEDPASSLYGSLIVSKIQHAAFSKHRSSLLEHQRIPFFLYIDEFEYFRASASFLKMLNMARSFKLCLTLANLRLSELDAEVRSALQIVSSLILLRIASSDKAAFADEIGTSDPGEIIRQRERRAYREWSHTKSERARTRWLMAFEEAQDHQDAIVTIEDAVKLGRYKAIFKIGDSSPVIAPTPDPPPRQPTQTQREKIARIKENTKRFGPTDANYAHILSIRSEGDEACNFPQVRHDEENGIDYDTIEPQSKKGKGKEVHKVDRSKTKRD